MKSWHCKKSNKFFGTFALAVVITLPLAASADPALGTAGPYLGAGGGVSREVGNGKWERSGKAFLWFDFNRVFSLEAGYVDLGKHDSDLGTTASERGPFVVAMVNFPVDHHFGPFIEAGAHRLELETRTTLVTTKEKATNPVWGAGFNLNFDRHVGLRMEWQRYKITDHDTDLISANLVFHLH